MERADTTSEESSETGEIKEGVVEISLNTEIEKSVEAFLKSEEDRDFSNLFSDWILNFIEQEVFNDPEFNIKLYDIFELFNQSLVKLRSIIKDSTDTNPSKPSHFEIEAILIEELIKKAVKNPKIFQFINSSKWNELRIEFCNKAEINYSCIESLEKLIMFRSLMQLKKDKYRLKEGW